MYILIVILMHFDMYLESRPTCEIWSSHISDCEDYCIVLSDIMQPRINLHWNVVKFLLEYMVLHPIRQ
jgi:hypothetical protein